MRGRRILRFSIALPVLAVLLWLAATVTHQAGLGSVLVGLAGIGMMGAAVVAEVPRVPSETGRRLVETEAPSEKIRVLIVGASASARRAAQELESSGAHEVVGFVSDSEHNGSEYLGVLGRTDEIPVLVHRLGVHQVVVAEAPVWQQRLSEMASADTRTPVGVHVVPGLYEARVGRLRFRSVRDLPLVDLAPADASPAYLAMKRALDMAVALIGLVLTAPAMALAALAIKLTSPGPVLFRQERVGKGGRTFTVLKLRTMVLDAEKHTGPVLSAGAADRRITPLGRLLRATRLDEVPQLLNVLCGEMSIVGPRPERPCFVQKFEAEIPAYRERHQVSPGITGLAQVHGGYAIDAEMKLRYDLLYAHHQSLWLDLKIMFQTVATMCRRTGQ